MTPATPLLRIADLKIVTEGRAATLLQDLSLDLHAGEFLALVGESGSGKTLATRAIVDLLPPGVSVAGGTIRFDCTDLRGLAPAGMQALRGNDIGLVFQEPMTSLNPAMTVGRQLEEGLRRHRAMRPDERRAACLAMLERVGIADPAACLASYPHEFSGGLRQRIMLASVMLLQPRLLIADEPTTALDTLSQREVMNVMTGLARENGTAVILITHDLGLVGRYADSAIVLEKGHVVERAAAQDLLRSPKHDYTRRLVTSLPQRPVARPAVAEPPLLTVDRLTVCYRRRGQETDFAAVDDVSLAVRPGEVVAVVGGSGSGKTTLGRAVLGLAPATRGKIDFAGLDPHALDRTAASIFRRESQLVFQDPYSSLDPRMRVRHIVAEPLRQQRDVSSIERDDRVASILADVDLTHLSERYPANLSGGQRQRVVIARALVGQPRFVVADEPVAALDATIQAQVLRLFAQLQARRGFACLFISHDLGVVEQIADRILVMLGGRLVEHGTRDDIFDRPQHPFTRALLAASPHLSTAGVMS